MTSLNMGSMNFALYPMADADQVLEIRLGGGLPPESDDYIFRNTFRDIEKISKMHRQGTWREVRA